MPFDPTSSVQTRDGRQATVLNNGLPLNFNDGQTIVAATKDVDNLDFVVLYYPNGQYWPETPSELDLVNV